MSTNETKKFEVIDLDNPKTDADWELKKVKILEQYLDPSISIETKIKSLAAGMLEVVHWNNQNTRDIIATDKTIHEQLGAFKKFQSYLDTLATLVKVQGEMLGAQKKMIEAQDKEIDALKVLIQ